MSNKRYVVAIEISSSKVVGVLGQIFPDGKLDIIAIESEKCVECVRYGIVQNVDDTAMRISRIIQRLEMNKEIAPDKISGIYIGLSGRSMRSIPVDVTLNFTDEQVISENAIEQLRRKAEEKAVDSSLDVIDAVPRSFRIGNVLTREPLGNLGKSIHATYDLIVCRRQLKKNINRLELEKRFGLHTNGFIVTPLATGQLVAPDTDKRLGCMLVDLGAETTTVTIYKEGDLRYFATLPIGSRNITRDIMSLSVLEETAEDLKQNNVSAIRSGSNAKALTIHGINQGEASEIVAFRAEEIVINIMEQITYAGLKEKDLPGGIILMGGGMLLDGMEKLIRETSKMNVRFGKLPAYITTAGKAPAQETLQAISILYAGATGNDAECVSRVTRDLPESGEPADYPDDRGHDDDENDNKNNHRPGGNRKRPNPILEKLRFGFGKARDMFTPKIEDDSDLIDE